MSCFVAAVKDFATGPTVKSVPCEPTPQGNGPNGLVGTTTHPIARGKDQQVSHANNEKTTDKANADATSTFYADFLGDLDTSTDAVVGADVWETGLPSGSAMLVVKRGPNAGSRFRLDPPVTSAGRHPDSDIFLDTSASADGTPSFEGKKANTCLRTPVASTEPMPTANRSNRRR